MEPWQRTVSGGTTPQPYQRRVNVAGVPGAVVEPWQRTTVVANGEAWKRIFVGAGIDRWQIVSIS